MCDRLCDRTLPRFLIIRASLAALLAFLAAQATSQRLCQERCPRPWIGIAASVSALLATGSFRHDLFVHLLASALVAVVSYLISRWIVFPQPSAE